MFRVFVNDIGVIVVFILLSTCVTIYIRGWYCQQNEHTQFHMDVYIYLSTSRTPMPTYISLAMYVRVCATERSFLFRPVIVSCLSGNIIYACDPMSASQ